MVLAAALSANRSGWLGIFIITVFGIVHSWRYYSKGYLILFFVLSIVYLGLVERYAEDVVDRKVAITREGYVSDYGRQLLIANSLLVGFENPIIGLGKDELHSEMGRRLNLSYAVDTHNLYGYLLGSGGLLTFATFFLYALSKTINLTVLSPEKRFLIWCINP